MMKKWDKYEHDATKKYLIAIQKYIEKNPNFPYFTVVDIRNELKLAHGTVYERLTKLESKKLIKPVKIVNQTRIYTLTGKKIIEINDKLTRFKW